MIKQLPVMQVVFRPELEGTGDKDFFSDYCTYSSITVEHLQGALLVPGRRQ